MYDKNILKIHLKRFQHLKKDSEKVLKNTDRNTHFEPRQARFYFNAGIP